MLNFYQNITMFGKNVNVGEMYVKSTGFHTEKSVLLAHISGFCTVYGFVRGTVRI